VPVLGVCRSLHTFNHYAEWRAFFSGLGVSVRLSEPVSRRALDHGVRLGPAELCLPVKAFLGQVEELSRQVDYSLLPRLVCRRFYGRPFFGCPKALALPDLVRALLPHLDNGLELFIDERVMSQKGSFFRAAAEMGFKGRRVSEAWRQSRQAAEEFRRLVRLRRGRLLPWDSDPNENEPGSSAFCMAQGQGLRVGVISHPYLLFDEVLSLGLLSKLERLGVQVLLPDFSAEPAAEDERDRVWPDWMYEYGLLVRAKESIANPEVAGLLLVSSFACGTAAVVNEVIRQEVARQRQIPVLTLLLDEHTGEAGLLTRLESFVELLKRRQSRS
jgi:predicted nucleotide-binding protein (sugar kinase/HSP70/actin superfamily)